MAATKQKRPQVYSPKHAHYAPAMGIGIPVGAVKGGDGLLVAKRVYPKVKGGR